MYIHKYKHIYTYKTSGKYLKNLQFPKNPSLN